MVGNDIFTHLHLREWSDIELQNAEKFIFQMLKLYMALAQHLMNKLFLSF